MLENRNNRVDPELKDLISSANLVALRDRKTDKCLGVSFTEEGLRGLANKNGVYIYCKGRVTNFSEAKRAERNPNVVVEKFVPRDFSKRDLATVEIHWALSAKTKLTQKQQY